MDDARLRSVMIRPTRWTVVALVGWSLALVGAIGGLLVRFLWPAPVLPTAFGVVGPAASAALALLGITWSTVGALLVIRRPDNPVGRIMLVIGGGLAISVLTMAIMFAAQADGSVGGHHVASIAGALTALLSPILILVVYLQLIFPTGRGHTPRWDRFSRTWLLVAMSPVALLLLQPGDVHLFPGVHNPMGFGPDLRPLFGEPVILGVDAVLILALAPPWMLSVASRFRQAGPIERQQLKWVIVATALTMATSVLVNLAVVLTSGTVGEAPLIAMFLAGTTIPLAIGAAILRYRLYDIDRLVSRTIAYGGITAILVATYAVVIVILQGLLGAVFGGDTLSVAVSTLTVAALFQPLRGRVQRLVQRRFDRARYDGERTASAFATRMRDAIDLPTVTGDFDATVRQAIAPSRIGLWLRGSAR
jgi:hypothetical protein